ncbi:MAG: ABC transporter substrate-binding protein [Deltaproteobacteria bacterium]|nr:ABC transporter substrate-binding protein [Deltaproteobacteria bacterium]MDZ4345243.1 ABC transporter substrate-binding protein [Candidatus Binatia bacterium]
MNKFSHKLSLTLLAVCGMLALTSAVVLAQAKTPGRVLLYTSVPQQLATQFTDAFMKKRPDVKVEIYRAGSTEVGAKIAAEREVGGIRADLLWLADAPVYYDLRKRGELLAYTSPEAKAIPADLKDPKGFFTAGRLINMIIAVNTQVIALKDAPKSWKDFPDAGNKAVMGNPLYSGSNFVTVAAFVKKDGDWSWFERARAKGVAIVRGNSEAATALAGKEFGVAMTLDYIVAGLIKKGAPLATVWPSDGAISVPSPIAIIKGTKNPTGSKAFVDYVLSKEGQEFLVKQEVIPVRDDVKPPAGQPSAKQIKFMPIPYEWAADNAPAIREKFEKTMLQ